MLVSHIQKLFTKTLTSELYMLEDWSMQQPGYWGGGGGRKKIWKSPLKQFVGITANFYNVIQPSSWFSKGLTKHWLYKISCTLPSRENLKLLLFGNQTRPGGCLDFDALLKKNVTKNKSMRELIIVYCMH